MTNNEYAKLTQIEQLLNTLLTIIQHQQEKQKSSNIVTQKNCCQFFRFLLTP